MSGDPTSSAQPADACRHCRGPTPAGAEFCCTGCEAVHGALLAAGLDDWYRLRDVDREALIGVAARPREDARYDYLDSQSYRERCCQPLQLVGADGEARDGLQARWTIDGMTCVACGWLIEQVAQQHPGVREARVDVLGQRLEVTFDAEARLQPLAAAIGAFGYGVGVGDASEDSGAARRQDLVHLATAGALMGNTMLLTVPTYAGLESGPFAWLFGVLALVLAAVSLSLPGRVFFVNAAAAFRVRHVSLDLPIALGLFAALAYSAVQLSRGAFDQLYFDSLTMLVFTLRLGRFFQARTVERAAAHARMLAAAMPELVPTLRDGAYAAVAPEALCKGDAIRLDPGMRLPVEATLTGAIAATDRQTESLPSHPAAIGGTIAHVDLQVVSGESAPRPMAVGAVLPAGARAVDEALLLTVREGLMAAQTAAQGVAGDVAAAHDVSRGPRRQPMLADRLGAAFTVAVLAIAAAAALYWGQEVSLFEGARVALVILIVACPCAIGLASPATVALAVAEAARRGVLVREASTFERAAELRAIVLDKTGTVTEGRPEVSDRWVDSAWAAPQRLLRALADVEGSSRHPIARGLCRALEGSVGALDAAPAAAVRIIGGEGICGVGALAASAACGAAGDDVGLAVLALSATAARRRGLDQGAAAARAFVASQEASGASIVLVYASRGGISAGAAPPAAEDASAWQLVACFGMRDALRADAAATVVDLQRALQLEVALLSGDTSQAVVAVADRIGIADARGAVVPSEKASAIATLRRLGPVAMVGDGQNDVAALRASSMAFSLEGATPGAISASEVVLQRGGLAGLAWLVHRGRRLRRDVRATLLLAGVTNAIGIGAAATGGLTPLVAAVWMPLSSALVVGFALWRARRAMVAPTGVAASGRRDADFSAARPLRGPEGLCAVARSA